MNDNVIAFRGSPKPAVEPSPELAAVVAFPKPKPGAAPVAPMEEDEPDLCPHCWALNAVEVTVTSAVAAGVDTEEILDRVFDTLGELGCLPPPPVAGRGA